MAGRKPKLTAVKKLEGNSGKRKLNSKEPSNVYSVQHRNEDIRILRFNIGRFGYGEQKNIYQPSTSKNEGWHILYRENKNGLWKQKDKNE